MRTESPQVHRVERVDDIPVLLATLQRLNVAEILDRHFPSGHRWKGALTFGEVACVWIAFITSQVLLCDIDSSRPLGPRLH